MNTHEILVKARELISDPARWTQEEIARDKTGYHTDAKDPAAVCWCATGALIKVCSALSATSVHSAFDALNAELDSDEEDDEYNCSYFNDEATHAQVLALFDKAIEATKP